jgi:hypothetical protein
MKSLIWLLILSAVIPGIMASVARAQTYALRARVAPGTTATFDQVAKDTTQSRPPDAAGDAFTANSSSVEHLFGHFAVTGLSDGSPNAMRITFNSESNNEFDADGEPAEITKSPLAGRTINLAMDAAHKYTDDYKGDLDDDVRDELHEFLVPDADMFPDHPVAVGDYWDASAKYAADLPLKKGESVLQWYRLDSVEKVNGRSIAHLTMSYGSVTRQDPGSVRILEATGTALVDLDRGAVTDVTMKGTYTVRADAGDKSVPADTGPVDATGTYEEHVKVTYDDAATTKPSR